MNAPPTHTRAHRSGISSPAFIALTLLGFCIVYGLCLLLVSSVIGGSEEKIESTQRRLVYATNPSLLMDACRQLASGYPSDGGPYYPSATSPDLPPILLKVRPKTITVDNHHVTLECGTSAYSFGLFVDLNAPTVATTRPSTQPAPPMATRLIAPGIWYYAQDHAVPAP
jgi:hypothetical protein